MSSAVVRLASRRHLEFVFIRTQASHGPEQSWPDLKQKFQSLSLYQAVAARENVWEPLKLGLISSLTANELFLFFTNILRLILSRYVSLYKWRIYNIISFTHELMNFAINLVTSFCHQKPLIRKEKKTWDYLECKVLPFCNLLAQQGRNFKYSFYRKCTFRLSADPALSPILYSK